MSIIKETLKEKIEKLHDEIGKYQKEHNEYFSSKIHEIVDTFDDLFKEFEILVSSDRIEFNLPGKRGWDSFYLKRSSRYTKEGFIYTPPTLSYSSFPENIEGLKRTICTGKLAFQCLYETNEWKRFGDIMDEYASLYEREISPLSDQIYSLQNQIRDIEKNERETHAESILNKGKLKFNKTISFYYGNGKFDRVASSEYEWEANSSGKTYTLFYVDSYNNIKHAVGKRIKKKDLQSFILGNENEIVKD